MVDPRLLRARRGLALVPVNISTKEPRPLAALCPGLPEELVREIHRCLEKSPTDRPSSVAALAAAIEPFGSPSSAGAGIRTARVLEGDPARERPSTTQHSPDPPDKETQPPQATSANSPTNATDAAISTLPERDRSPRSITAALVLVPLLAAVLLGVKVTSKHQGAAPAKSHDAPSATSLSLVASVALDPPREASLPSASAPLAQPIPSSATVPSVATPAQRPPARVFTREQPASKVPLLPEYGARK